MIKKAVVVLADGFEEIEAVTPIDILRRASVEVVVAGLDNKVITGSHRIKINADILFEEIKDLPDVLILPGGSPGAENLAKSTKLRDFIIRAVKADKFIAAICASPALVLEPIGILKNKKATCFPGMEKLFSQDVKFSEEAVVRDGNLITSRGPGTAILFTLAIVEALIDKKTAGALREKILANPNT